MSFPSNPPGEALGPDSILNNLNDGVYITDSERRILYWSDAAERITGWSRQEVIGKCCRDQILEHVDKDGRPLCGKEHCPLHRTIMTGQATKVPIIVFAKTRDGRRVPMHVSTAPLRDVSGEVVGAIEIFRDMTHLMGEMERAKSIQASALVVNVARDPRIEIRTLYSPRDIVGGDFYSVEDLDADRVVLFIADVMGHGIAAALYSMFFRMLWAEHRDVLGEPARFLTMLDARIHPLIKENFYFATAAFLLFNKATGELRCAGAGHPAPLVFREDGSVEAIDCSAFPLGLVGIGGYKESATTLRPGDSLLLYTDGAVEATNREGEELGQAGLIQLVRETLQPDGGLSLKGLEVNLLRVSNEIRPADDVTFVWLTYRASAGMAGEATVAEGERPLASRDDLFDALT